MSFKNSFVKMDVFRKMPKDLTEPTFFGALSNILFSINAYSFVCMYSCFGFLMYF